MIHHRRGDKQNSRKRDALTVGQTDGRTLATANSFQSAPGLHGLLIRLVSFDNGVVELASAAPPRRHCRAIIDRVLYRTASVIPFAAFIEHCRIRVVSLRDGAERQTVRTILLPLRL